MYSLRRTMAAGFTADQAVTLEEVQTGARLFSCPQTASLPLIPFCC